MIDGRKTEAESMRIASTAAVRLLALCVCLAVGCALLASDTSAGSAEDDWHIADHPNMHTSAMRIVTADSMSTNSNSAAQPTLSWHELVQNVTARMPAIAHWLLRNETKQGIKTIKRVLLLNFISPVDAGDSLHAALAQKNFRSALKMLFLDDLAQPLWSTLQSGVYNLLLGGMAKYLQRAMLETRLQAMSADQIMQAFHISLSAADQAALERLLVMPTTNATLPFVPKPSLVLSYAECIAHFTPYANYTQDYFLTNDAELSSPSLPVMRYPWPWTSQLAQARRILLRLRRWYAHLQANESKHDGSASASFRNEDEGKDESVGVPSVDSNTSAEPTIVPQLDILVLEHFLHAFEFETGLPRLPAQVASSPNARFPTLPEYWEMSMTTKLSNTSNYSVMSPRAWVQIIYQAARACFAFPVDRISGISKDAKLNQTLDEVGQPTAACSSARPCFVRSGVTVYTPSLLDCRMTTRTRLARIQQVLRDACAVEHGALRLGLLAPSTVWRAMYDRDVDLFADAMLGFANMTIQSHQQQQRKMASRISPRRVYDALLTDPASPMLMSSSYFVMTQLRQPDNGAEDSSIGRDITPSQAFDQNALGELVDQMQDAMQMLEEEIARYRRQRDRDVQRAHAVIATQQALVYTGRTFSSLAFGALLPSTNAQHVAYRDWKVPVPFHLVLRVLVRLQESHLLRAEEARHLVACLAMRWHHMPFYRCRAISS